MKTKIFLLTVLVFSLSLSVFSSNGDNYVEKRSSSSVDNYLNELTFAAGTQSSLASSVTFYAANASNIGSYYISMNGSGYSVYPYAQGSSKTCSIYGSTNPITIIINGAKAYSDGRSLNINITSVSGVVYTIRKNRAKDVEISMDRIDPWGQPSVSLSFD